MLLCSNDRIALEAMAVQFDRDADGIDHGDAMVFPDHAATGDILETEQDSAH